MNLNKSVFRDPENGDALAAFTDEGFVTSGGKIFPIVREIPRFVSSENYAAAFGAQWNMFPKTQLDSNSGVSVSEDRLSRCMQGNLESIAGTQVLEAGSGAGRFSEVLLKYGAQLHSFDFSSAVEANASNNGDSNQLSLAQADIRKIPFPRADYDYVVCLGVLQHTPDPEESIRSLWHMVKPGGALVIDHYRWTLRWMLPPPIRDCVGVYRWVILRLPQASRFGVVKRLTDRWFPLHWRFRDSLFMQRLLRRVSPVIFHYPGIRLKDRQAHYEWSLLDTHDSTTDFYKHMRTPRQIEDFLTSLGATEVVVKIGGNGVEAFCRKPR
jgi:SAM-dependent methyltransferase